MDLVHNRKSTRHERTVRLDVHVIPWEEAADRHQRELIKPWVEPCAGNMTIHDLEAKIRLSFSTIHYGKGDLHIKHLLTYTNAMINPINKVGEVFRRQDIVKVERHPPSPDELKNPLRFVAVGPESTAIFLRRSPIPIALSLPEEPTTPVLAVMLSQPDRQNKRDGETAQLRSSQHPAKYGGRARKRRKIGNESSQNSASIEIVDSQQPQHVEQDGGQKGEAEREGEGSILYETPNSPRVNGLPGSVLRKRHNSVIPDSPPRCTRGTPVPSRPDMNPSDSEHHTPRLESPELTSTPSANFLGVAVIDSPAKTKDLPPPQSNLLPHQPNSSLPDFGGSRVVQSISRDSFDPTSTDTENQQSQSWLSSFRRLKGRRPRPEPSLQHNTAQPHESEDAPEQLNEPQSLKEKADAPARRTSAKSKTGKGKQLQPSAQAQAQAQAHTTPQEPVPRDECRIEHRSRNEQAEASTLPAPPGAKENEDNIVAKGKTKNVKKPKGVKPMSAESAEKKGEDAETRVELKKEHEKAILGGEAEGSNSVELDKDRLPRSARRSATILKPNADSPDAQSGSSSTDLRRRREANLIPKSSTLAPPPSEPKQTPSSKPKENGINYEAKPVQNPAGIVARTLSQVSSPRGPAQYMSRSRSSSSMTPLSRSRSSSDSVDDATLHPGVGTPIQVKTRMTAKIPSSDSGDVCLSSSPPVKKVVPKIDQARISISSGVSESSEGSDSDSRDEEPENRASVKPRLNSSATTLKSVQREKKPLSSSSRPGRATSVTSKAVPAPKSVRMEKNRENSAASGPTPAKQACAATKSIAGDKVVSTSRSDSRPTDPASATSKSVPRDQLASSSPSVSSLARVASATSKSAPSASVSTRANPASVTSKSVPRDKPVSSSNSGSAAISRYPSMTELFKKPQAVDQRLGKITSSKPSTEPKKAAFPSFSNHGSSSDEASSSDDEDT